MVTCFQIGPISKFLKYIELKKIHQENKIVLPSIWFMLSFSFRFVFSVHILHTGEHQPYAAGLKSGHSPAEASRFNHTFFRGSNLLTVAGEPPVASPANLGR